MVTRLVREDLVPAGIFAVFVSWLTIFPMSGGVPGGDMLWFLVPHVVSLIAVACLIRSRVFRLLFPVALWASLTIGVMYAPLADRAGELLLFLLGVVAAPVSIRMGMVLRTAHRPIVAAALGLAAGNLIAVALVGVNMPVDITIPLVSLAMLLVLLRSQESEPGRDIHESQKGLMVFLPFIFAFQLISGVMYGGLMPVYSVQAKLAGLELFFYAAAVLGAVRLFRHSRGVTLLVAVVTVLLSFALWQIAPEPSGLYLGMYLMMAAVGFFDLFVLGLVLSFANQIRAYGLGIGTLCAGIVAGRCLILVAGEQAEFIGLVGLLLLNLAVLVLFLPWRGTHAAIAPGAFIATTAVEEASSRPLPEEVARLLSDREQNVLRLVRTGMTYKEIAKALAISESSVKTYMQRIYQKTGIVRRHQIDELLDTDGEQG